MLFLSFPTIDDAVAWSIHLQLVLRRSDWNSSEQLLTAGLEDSRDGGEENETNSRGESSNGGDFMRSCSFSSNSSQTPHRGLSDRSRSSDNISVTDNDYEDSLFSFSSTHTFPTMSMQMRHLVLVQVGICYGMPNKVTPHVQTGRADYFGPIVNLSARVAKQTEPGDIHLSSYTDLSHLLSAGKDGTFGDDSDDLCGATGTASTSSTCFLKGMEFANEGKWVDIQFQDRGKKEFKGVRDKTKVYSVQISSDPFAQDTPCLNTSSSM